MNKPESAWAWIIRSLIDKPGQTAAALCVGRPYHLKPSSIGSVAGRLVRDGVLVAKGAGLQRTYVVAALAKLSAGRQEGGKPNSGSGSRDHTVRKVWPKTALEEEELAAILVSMSNPYPPPPQMPDAPQPPEDHTPGIVIWVGGKRRLYTIGQAHEIWAALDKIFGGRG